MASSPSNSEIILKLIAKCADDTKAEDIVILDMREIVNFCDYFLICSGNNERHVRAIADNITEGLAKGGYSVPRPQSSIKSNWVVYDFGEIIVHIFEKDLREFYSLEYLWQDAKRIDWNT
jgi:ribosome-associated protein